VTGIEVNRSAVRRAAPWTLLGERPRTGGWLPVTTRTYRMPDGSVSDWDIHTTPFSTVAVLALTPDRDVIATRQFRPGPGEVVVDLPGGIVDDPEALALAVAALDAAYEAIPAPTEQQKAEHYLERARLKGRLAAALAKRDGLT